MDLSAFTAVSIFALYFILILVSFVFVGISIFSSAKPGPAGIVEGRPFLFVRVAVGALASTWYYMIQFMLWSYRSFSKTQGDLGFSQWLVNTALFEQAWGTVCSGPSSWWWSSFICTWTVIFTAVIYQQSARRGIRFPLAYMVLGQLVAISVSTSLFLVAVYLHPPILPSRLKAPWWVFAPLVAALASIHTLPSTVGTATFLSQLVWIHALLLVPLLTVPSTSTPPCLPSLSLPFSAVYTLLIGATVAIHIPLTQRVLALVPTSSHFFPHLYNHIFSHSAQSSISFDVIWVAITLFLWLLFSGSVTSIIAKSTTAGLAAAVAAGRYLGVDWSLILSIVPMGMLLIAGGLMWAVSQARTRNITRREAVLDSLGIRENVPVPGTTGKPPSMGRKITVVGFWHPYCNAGGGGERVLWSAIAYLQRTEPNVVSLVYSGDYPEASKEEIIAKVMDRFSIRLDPGTLHFIPLPSRYLISDNYWRHFTLLGQSVGSMWLAWEGLCGKNGLWGDIFIDSMGYAFTLPMVRLLAGSEVAVGAYVHYPTVSADMVKRVRAREAGVESGGASSSALKTWIKLIYYQIFTSIYSVCLLFSRYTMTNSSWTQAHIESLLTHGRGTFLASVFLMDDLTREKRQKRGEPIEEKGDCEVVYPPCDTVGLTKLGGLEKRERELVSLAQFRPEKDHAKQIYALESLFKSHPEYRSGPQRISLTMMGGSRGEADEARLEALRQLAKTLGVEENVTFLVNAPYPEVVERLGRASIGLNTMQDEHFGINVVEFLAAGLIPVVHASAGPLMDIVVPYEGQRTGFHATTAESFAESVHAALSLPAAAQLAMRRAGRAAAVDRFSLEMFEQGFAKGWKGLIKRKAAGESGVGNVGGTGRGTGGAGRGGGEIGSGRGGRGGRGGVGAGGSDRASGGGARR